MSKRDIDELVRWRDQCEALAASLQLKVRHCAEITEERDKALRERDEARAEAKRRLDELNMVQSQLTLALHARDEARAEVEQLKAQHIERHLESWKQYMQDNDVKRAFRRGAEAMREACAREASVCANHRGEELDAILSALPIPEEP